MSSILDALKKLEEEKAARRPGGNDASSDPVTPFETVNDSSRYRRRQDEVSVTPKSLLIAGLGMSIVLVVVSVSVSMVLMRGQSATPTVASLPPVVPQEAAPSVETPPPAAAITPPEPEVAPEPVSAANAPTAPAPKPEPKAMTASAVKAEPVPAAKPEPVREPAPEPKPEPMQVADAAPQAATPAPRAEIPALAPAPAPEPVYEAPAPVATPEPTPPPPEPQSLEAKDVEPVADLKSLPVLRTSDRISLGLENMRVNFLRESTPSRPTAMAVINLNKIHLGEVIPGTRARLVAVERSGIGIEIADTGKRYYIPL